jgi:hypothetical protein
MKTSLISIIVIFAAFCSCSNSRSNTIGIREGSAIVVDASKVTETVNIALSRWIENLEIIQLDDSTVEAFFAYPSITISENYIGIFDDQKPYKLFDRRNGKFLHKIGDIGRGPGEYLNIYSAQLDEAADRIYIMQWPSCDHLLVFDLKNKFIGNIPLAFTTSKGQFRVDSKNRKVIVSTISMFGLGKIAWQQDLEGNIIGGVEASEFPLQSPSFDDEIFFLNNTPDFDFQLMLSIPTNKTDYLYNFNTEYNKLEPIFKIIVKDKGYINDRTLICVNYTELPNCFIGNIETSQWAGSGLPWKKQNQTLFVNKTDLTGAWFRLKDDFLGIDNVYLRTTSGYYQGGHFKDGYFIRSFDPLPFIKILRDAEIKGNINSEQIFKLRKSIKEDGNNVLVFGKLK